MIKLYHGGDVVGSRILSPAELGGWTCFGMFYSHSLHAAKSHGDNIVSVEIDVSDILDVDNICWEEDIALKAVELFGGIIDDELLIEFLSERKSVYNYCSSERDIIALNNRIADVTGAVLFRGEQGLAMLDWAFQSASCYIAKHLGYSGVTTNDEHGLSFCLVPGLNFKKEIDL